MPHMLPYVASKFALVGFSEGLHAELRHKGIRVTTVCPGLMRTGGEVHAHYTGQTKREQRWFTLAARTPILAASVRHAANKIYNAVAAGRAEITITPQAWLAARVAGLAPETTQYLASLANQLLLPAPSTTDQLNLGFTLKVSTYLAERVPRPTTRQPHSALISADLVVAHGRRADLANRQLSRRLCSSDSSTSLLHPPPRCPPELHNPHNRSSTWPRLQSARGSSKHSLLGNQNSPCRTYRDSKLVRLIHHEGFFAGSPMHPHHGIVLHIHPDLAAIREFGITTLG